METRGAPGCRILYHSLNAIQVTRPMHKYSTMETEREMVMASGIARFGRSTSSPSVASRPYPVNATNVIAAARSTSPSFHGGQSKLQALELARVMDDGEIGARFAKKK